MNTVDPGDRTPAPGAHPDLIEDEHGNLITDDNGNPIDGILILDEEAR